MGGTRVIQPSVCQLWCCNHMAHICTIFAGFKRKEWGTWCHVVVTQWFVHTYSISLKRSKWEKEPQVLVFESSEDQMNAATQGRRQWSCTPNPSFAQISTDLKRTSSLISPCHTAEETRRRRSAVVARINRSTCPQNLLQVLLVGRSSGTNPWSCPVIVCGGREALPVSGVLSK